LGWTLAGNSAFLSLADALRRLGRPSIGDGLPAGKGRQVRRQARIAFGGWAAVEIVGLDRLLQLEAGTQRELREPGEESWPVDLSHASTIK